MPPRPKTAKLSQNPLKFKNKGDRPLIFPVNADTARKTTRQRTPSNFKFNGSPIIALLIAILVICLLGSFVFRKNALAVVVNNNTIGYIKDTSTTEDEFKHLITAKLKETVGNELEINESIKLKPVNGLFKHVSGNSEEVISKVCESVTYKQQATSIQVEGKPYVTVSNIDQAKEALSTTLKKYKAPAGTTDPEFAIQIGTANVFVDNKDVLTVDQAVEKLSETKQVTRTHTVVAGDTFASIASNAGMTEAELLKANPSISAESKTNLQIGQKLTVTSNVPVLPIRTFKTTTKEEIIDFTAVRTKNYNMPVGYSKVTTPGQEGKKQVIEKIPYINGEQSGVKKSFHSLLQNRLKLVLHRLQALAVAMTILQVAIAVVVVAEIVIATVAVIAMVIMINIKKLKAFDMYPEIWTHINFAFSFFIRHFSFLYHS